MRRHLPLVLFLMGGECSGTACPPSGAVPMTVARAAEIDPTIETGLAVSTTHVFGDCRAGNPTLPPSTCNGGRCAREREPFHVVIIPVNVSVPIAERCAPGFAVSDAVAESVFEGYASDEGELVIALEPGRYRLYVSADDRCAVCGLGEGECTVDIAAGEVTVRDLVLDQSSH